MTFQSWISSESKTLRQESLVKGREKSWNPIRALDPSCEARYGERQSHTAGWGLVSVWSTNKAATIETGFTSLVFFFPPQACVYQKNKVSCGFEDSTLIGIPGENQIWGEAVGSCFWGALKLWEAASGVHLDRFPASHFHKSNLYELVGWIRFQLPKSECLFGFGF